MKTYSLIVLLFLAEMGFSLNVKEALANNLISTNWSGVQTRNIPLIKEYERAPSMQVDIQNKTTSTIDLELDEGYFLVPVEQGYQRMLITQKIKLKLKPNERKEVPLYAMCTQNSHSGPNSKLKYKLSERATGDLLALAKLIAQKNYQNYAAQDAVWSFTDGTSILDINSQNTTMENELQSFVANAMKVDLQKVKQEAKTKDKLGEQRVENLYLGKKIDRNIAFKNDTAIQLKVGYYDQNDNLLANIVEAQSVMPGHHSIRYNPFPLPLQGKRYCVKMYHNDELYRVYYFRQ